MAVTKIWNIRGKAGSPLEYIANPEKTEREFTEPEKQALQPLRQGLVIVVEYVGHCLLGNIPCRKLKTPHTKEMTRLVECASIHRLGRHAEPTCDVSSTITAHHAHYRLNCSKNCHNQFLLKI